MDFKSTKYLRLLALHFAVKDMLGSQGADLQPFFIRIAELCRQIDALDKEDNDK